MLRAKLTGPEKQSGTRKDLYFARFNVPTGPSTVAIGAVCVR